MDKGETWIMGVKIRADDEQAYWQGMREARKKNKKLGYGGYITPEEELKAEHRRKELLVAERIRSAFGGTPAGGGLILGYMD